MVDTLDVRILRAFIQGRSQSPITPQFRVSVAAIAKMLGEDDDVVRHRLKRIQDSGFVSDFRLYVNPSLWGGGHASARFEIEPTTSKQEIVERLRLVPGMTHVGLFYDSVVPLFDFEDEAFLPRQLELIRHLLKRSEVFAAKDAFPPCHAALTPRDWDIIRALRKNPRRSYAELGAEVRLSARTTKARLAHILAQNVAFAWPTVNMRSSLGGMIVQLEVRYPGERKAELDAAIIGLVEPYLWHVLHMLPLRPGELWPCGYNLVVPNLAAAQQVLDAVKGLPGVSSPRVYLYEGIMNFFDEYEEALDRRLRLLPTVRPAPRRERSAGRSSGQ